VELAGAGFWYYLSRLPAGLYADQAEEPAPAAVGEDSATT
jgi:hypothetical protein